MGAPMPVLAGATHRWVHVRGARLHVAEVGSGPPVVLVHGWPQHWWCWREVMARLQDSARVIAVDLRGFGWSEATPGGYEKAELASDLVGVLDALELDRVPVAGHDWGGVAGLLACVEHPERFERFVALNTGHPWVSPDARLLGSAWRFSYQWLLASPGAGPRAAASRSFVRTLLRAGSTRREPVLAALDTYASVLREPARALATQQLYRTFSVHELPAWMRGAYSGRRLTVPTLWLHGLDDAAIRPTMIESIAEHADDVRVELVPGVGHFICEEAPELVSERIRSFCALDGVSRPLKASARSVDGAQ